MSNPVVPSLQDARPSRPRPTSESISRKKACEQCSVAKVRCDHKKPRCTRCESRRINCDYAASQRRSVLDTGQGELNMLGTYNVLEYTVGDGSMGISSQNTPRSNDSGFVTSPSTFPAAPDNVSLQNGQTGPQQIDLRIPRTGPALSHRPQTVMTEDAPPNEYWPNQALNFADVDLVCTVDVTKIRNRWLGDFIPSFNQRTKNHPPSITLFISRVFKTYPTILLRKGHLPPFIHPSQFSGSEISTPLANCVSLVRMWNGQVRGSENMVREIIKNEMMKLYEEVTPTHLNEG